MPNQTHRVAIYHRQEQEVLALIPARGGSKGIRRKNLQPLGGRPLIAWSICHALNAPSVTRVVVTTDDPEIAQVATTWGAQVVNRPSHLASCIATSESALSHALDFLADTEDYNPSLVVFLQATSPLRGVLDIEDAIATFRVQQADSLFSCVCSHGFLWRMDDTGPFALNYNPQSRPRRQDAPEDVIENGSLYLFKPSVLEKHNSRLGGRIAAYKMLPQHSFQIDEPNDLVLMSALLDQPKPPPESRVFVPLRLLLIRSTLMTNPLPLNSHFQQLMLAGVEIRVLVPDTSSARTNFLDCHVPVNIGPLDTHFVGNILNQCSLQRHEVAFVGNMDSDLEAMAAVGVPIATAEATSLVRANAIWVTTTDGIDAIEEISTHILAAHLPPTTNFEVQDATA